MRARVRRRDDRGAVDVADCWYQVQVAFSGGSNVTDVTTWTANISGDPVRLIE